MITRVEFGADELKVEGFAKQIADVVEPPRYADVGEGSSHGRQHRQDGVDGDRPLRGRHHSRSGLLGGGGATDLPSTPRRPPASSRRRRHHGHARGAMAREQGLMGEEEGGDVGRSS